MVLEVVPTIIAANSAVIILTSLPQPSHHKDWKSLDPLNTSVRSISKTIFVLYFTLPLSKR